MWNIRLFLCIAAGFFLAARGQEQAEETREVSGVVKNAATGQPLEGATAAVGNFLSVTRSATTGADGRFRFTGVKQGEQLKVWKRGYRTPDGRDVWMANQFSGKGEAEVVLTALGAIAGVVTDERGEALLGITVQGLKSTVREGRRKLNADATFRTDDRGRYRLWHLMPGRYVVKALGRRSTVVGLGAMPQTREGDLAYGPQYYPNSATGEGASVVEVKPGETTEADFRLVGQPAARVQGRLTNYKAYDPVEVELKRGREEVGSRVAVNEATGAFQATGVAPGLYTVVAKVASKPPREGRAEVTVGAEGVTGVVVRLVEGVEVRGAVAGESRKAFVMMSLTRLDTGEWEPVRSVMRENQDGIRFEGVTPGRYQVDLLWGAVEAVRSGTVDVLREGLTVTEAGCEPLEVTLSANPGELEIEAEGGGGDVEVGALRGIGEFVSMRSNGIRDEGKARLDGLAPGEYRVYAWRRESPLEYTNAAALEAAGGVTVVVKAGETTKVRVRVPEKTGGAQ